MITIQVKVTGHELSLISSPILSSDSIQFDRINFQFDSNWDGFNKVALFWGGDSDTPYGSLVDAENNATIPAEVIAEKGTIRFGVYGEDPEDLRPRITSTILKYKVREGTWSDSVEGDDEVTETLIDQLKQIAYNAYGNAEQFIEDAQEYLTQAQTETAQNIAQNNAAVAANIQQNNAAVAANIQQNNTAITEYIAGARETTQEYLDEVTEMAEGAKDSAKVAAQAAIDAAAPCLTYSTLYEYQSSGPVIQKVGDYLSIEDVGDYDYLDIIYSNGTNTTEYSKMQSPVFANYKRFALVFGNSDYIDLPVTLEFPYAYIDSNAISMPNRSLMINAVLRVNRVQNKITFLYAIDETFTYDSQTYMVNDAYINADVNVEGLPVASVFNITKIIGWKYSNIASKQLLSHDPELLDVRIGADGTIYASAGDAMRGQIEEAEEIAFASYPARETSGATVSFLDGGDNAPVKELEVDISSVSGVTGASIERLGKNLANVSDNTYTNSGITFTISDGAVQMAGTSTATINRTIGTVKLLAGVTYAISGTKSSGISDADVLRVDLRTSGGSVVASGDSYNGFAYTPNADTNAQVNIRLASGQTLDTTIYPQIEIGSIATEFEPYSPTVYTVDWTDEAGSIQSGTWDVLGGKLTVNGTTHDVTPIDVRTLLGSNTFSADCGDISMVYRADPALSLVEKYEKPSTGIPKTDLAADVQTSLGKADTALQSAPVTSVAGKTGAVTLDGGDVGYSVGSTYSSGTVGKSLQNTENGLALLQQTVDQLGGDKIPFDFSGYVPSEESIADVVNEISDDVTDLKSVLSQTCQSLSFADSIKFSRGSIYTGDGTYYPGSNPTTRCTSGYIAYHDVTFIGISGIYIFVFYYTANTYLGYVSVTNGAIRVTDNYPAADNIRLMLIKNPESQIGDGTSGDLSDVTSRLAIVDNNIVPSIPEINTKINALSGDTLPIEWRQGVYDVTTGDFIPNNSYSSTGFTYVPKGATLKAFGNGQQYRLYSADVDKPQPHNFSEVTSAWTSTDIEYSPDSDKYIFIVVTGTVANVSVTLAFVPKIGFSPYTSGFVSFTVQVNNASPVTTGTENEVKDTEVLNNATCKLKMPASYTPTGKPSKLLMICHGAGRGMVGDNAWTTQTGYNNIVDAFVSAGYFVFDCQGYADTVDGRSFWGAKQGVEAWRKAYDYIVSNYNVEHEFSIYAFSMGGLTSLGLAFDSYPNIKAIALASPVLDLTKCVNEATMRTAYDLSSATYDESKCRGCNPMGHVFNINNNDAILATLPPIKVWYGGNETNSSSQPYVEKLDAQKFVNAVVNGGGYAIYREIAGVGHEICYGLVPSAITEYVMFLNRY